MVVTGFKIVTIFTDSNIDHVYLPIDTVCGYEFFIHYLRNLGGVAPYIPGYASDFAPKLIHLSNFRNRNDKIELLYVNHISN